MPVKFKHLSVGASVVVCVCAHLWAIDLSRGQGPGGLIQRLKFCQKKEMRILRTLGSYDFKLQPFPDERLDSNLVCSTGVNTYPSASNIQRMASVFWRDDYFNLPFASFFFFFWGGGDFQKYELWWLKLKTERNRDSWSAPWILHRVAQINSVSLRSLEELTGCATENPSTNKALFTACFLKDTSCPLSKDWNWTSLFHGENGACARANVFQMRRVCACAFVCVFLLRVTHLPASVDDRQQIREAEARWLMPALSDWQRRTYHYFSSPVSSVINLICLILKM